MLTTGISRELLPAARMRRSYSKGQQEDECVRRRMAYVLEHLRQRASSAVAITEYKQ